MGTDVTLRPLHAAAAAAALVLVTTIVHSSRRRQSVTTSAAAEPAAPDPDDTQQPQRRIFKPLATVLTAINEGASSEEAHGRKRSKSEAINADVLTELRRTWVLEAVERQVPVPLRLWIAYRLWVDTIITARAGRAENFHSFVYAHTLGLPSPQKLKTHWSGSDAADLLACLADAGLLRSSGMPGSGSAEPSYDAADALQAWLSESLNVFDGRFLFARHRVYEGLGFGSEGEWQGQ